MKFRKIIITLIILNVAFSYSTNLNKYFIDNELSYQSSQIKEKNNSNSNVSFLELEHESQTRNKESLNNHISYKKLRRSTKNKITTKANLKKKGQIKEYIEKQIQNQEKVQLKKNVKPKFIIKLSDRSLKHVDDINDLCEEIKLNRITSLVLDNNHIELNGIKLIIEALQTNTRLTSLSIVNNKISPNEAILLRNLLNNKLNNIQSLDLAENNIGNDGVNLLMEALKDDECNLTYLNLKNNGLTDEGVKSISNALESNQKLERLILTGNTIGDDGAELISKALQTNKTISILELTNNNIEDTGVVKLVNSIEKKKKFYLEISSNMFKEESTFKLIRNANRNNASIHINIGEMN